MHTYAYTCISNRCFPYKLVFQDVSGKHARYEVSKCFFIVFQFNITDLGTSWLLAPGAVLLKSQIWAVQYCKLSSKLNFRAVRCQECFSKRQLALKFTIRNDFHPDF